MGINYFWNVCFMKILNTVCSARGWDMMRHYEIAQECWRELEMSSADIEWQMKLETWLIRLKRLLLQHEPRLYAADSPCTLDDLGQLRDMLRAWNKTAPTDVAVSEIEAHAMGLVRLLEKG
jgi:hypothetical protein